MMERIVITLPYFTEDEAPRITAMLDSAGAARVHIRKPGASAADVAALVEAVPARLHPRLSLHYHPEVALRYGCGVHLSQGMAYV
ncbi:MAG: thiamine phosphate synthase, partial [Muribaculaceae bacterium]|nr:thiamine phosphate synthase [Muribaculaceae bacterium]